MASFVLPRVYLIGYTTLDHAQLCQYLEDTDNGDFAYTMAEARRQSLSDGEILTSFYAKLCYASLSLGHNDNLTRIRDIPQNLKATWEQGHGSVWEHVNLNFVVTNCSRVFTHELVRHRVGTAFSQTSGRYVRGDKINLIFDPILEPVRDQVETLLHVIEDSYNRMVKTMDLDNMKDFTLKKQVTSALRRILPNGQSNEIGFSINLRALRHTVQMRTSRHAEWEIREVFAQVYRLIKDRYPLLFHGAKEEVVKGIVEVSGMKMQPYDTTITV